MRNHGGPRRMARARRHGFARPQPRQC
jgi:hypothetical protein